MQCRCYTCNCNGPYKWSFFFLDSVYHAILCEDFIFHFSYLLYQLTTSSPFKPIASDTSRNISWNDWPNTFLFGVEWWSLLFLRSSFIADFWILLIITIRVTSFFYFNGNYFFYSPIYYISENPENTNI